MAARVPVIASNVDGVPEVLAGGSGVLLDHRTPKAFADAAEALLMDSKRGEAIVNAARRRVEAVFSVEQTAKGVEQVYRRAIRETVGARTRVARI
jgi:glycosyltransferase involved in cell wall biosynthesis